MNRKSSLYLLVVLMAGLLTLWGCPKNAEVTSTPEAQTEQGTSTAATTTAEAPGNTSERSGMEAEGLQPVYFDFDRSAIRADARDAMKANAEWLKAHPSVKVKIEGNCDERGTIEYNQALGQRRCASAKRYLVDLGISSHRILLISYGKEKPICNDHDESCWQKNRRDDFVAVGE
jgi:peptidoglycan-associated lipoprotein